MWFWMRSVRSWTSAGFEAERGVLPSSSRNTQEGVSEPFDQTRLCPRTRMPFFWANCTSESATENVNCPSCGSVNYHFMSFPETMLSKCFVRSWACGPVRSDVSISAPTGKYCASV